MNILEGPTPPHSFKLMRREGAYHVSGSVKSNGWSGITAEKDPLDAGTWASVGMIYHSGDIFIVKDGAVVARRLLRDAGLEAGSGDTLFLGAWVNGRRNPFRGLVAGLRVWDQVPPHLQTAVDEARSDSLGVLQSAYLAAGGASLLGAPEAPLVETDRGRKRRYEKGAVYWTPETGAHEVHGSIHERYLQLGAEDGPLGYPVTNEIDGRRSGTRKSRFEGGGIYWSGRTGAHELFGEASAHYEHIGGAASVIGLPTGPPREVGDGTDAPCQRGTLLWSPETGAHEVHGSILERYRALGGPRSFMGFPLSDEVDVSDDEGNRFRGGRQSRFEGGTLFWSPRTGAQEVHGSIRRLYGRDGGPAGGLGFPLTDEKRLPDDDVRYNDFQNGIIVWRRGHGAAIVEDLELRLGKVQAEALDGDEFDSDNATELLTKTTVVIDGHRRWNKKNHRDDDKSTVNLDARFRPRQTIHHGTKIELSIDAYDHDTWNDADKIGAIRRTFDIRNLWGLTDSGGTGAYEDPSDRKYGPALSRSTVEYRFSMEQPVPYDRDADFRSWGAWRFDNFSNRAPISKALYADVFTDVEQGEWKFWEAIGEAWDAVFYEMVKGLGGPGNCFGWSLEVVYALMGRSLFGQPLYRHEAISDEIKLENDGDLPKVLRETIQKKHLYQCSASIIRHTVSEFLTTRVFDPQDVFHQVERYVRRGDYPVLSMMRLDEMSGHSVMAYDTRRGQGNDPNQILVADPNRVWSEQRAETTIDIFDNDRFYFSGDLQSRHAEIPGTGGNEVPLTALMAIPYSRMSAAPRTPFWEALLGLKALTGGLILVAGDAEVEQMSADGQQLLRDVEGTTTLISDEVKGFTPVPMLQESPGTILQASPGALQLFTEAEQMSADGQQLLRDVKGTPTLIPDEATGFTPVPMLQAGPGALQLFAKRGPMPADFSLDVRGHSRGSYQQFIHDRRYTIMGGGQMTPGARDSFTLANHEGDRPEVRIGTSEVRKTLNLTCRFGEEESSFQEYKLSLPATSDTPARVRFSPRTKDLILDAPQADAPVNLEFGRFVEGEMTRSKIRLEPDRLDGVQRIRPEALADPRTPIVIEDLPHINGPVLNRDIVDPDINVGSLRDGGGRLEDL